MNSGFNNIGVDAPKKRQKLEECPHKERCYRKNPHHFKQFEHPFRAFEFRADSMALIQGIFSEQAGRNGRFGDHTRKLAPVQGELSGAVRNFEAYLGNPQIQ